MSIFDFRYNLQNITVFILNVFIDYLKYIFFYIFKPVLYIFNYS